MSQTLTALLTEHRHLFHPVVPFDPEKDKLITIDLTAANSTLTDTLLEDVRLFSEWVNTQLRQDNARYAIGGYDEHRTAYSKNRVFDAVNGTESGVIMAPQLWLLWMA